MDRRAFLKLLAATAPVLSCASRLYAAPAIDTRFLLVFLRGGYDAANILIPHASRFYYEARPTIAIARPDPANKQAALAINADWGLHPALRDSIWPLYQRGQAAFIPFAGTDDVSRSHFETQDSIEMAQPPGHKDYNSGFINRLVAALAGRHGIAFTDALPIACKGRAPISNLSMKGLGKSAFNERQAAIFAEMYKGHALQSYVNEGLELRQEIAGELEQEMEQASRGAIPAHGFEEQAKRMAQLMQEKYTIGFADVGGWDTHLGQGGAEGPLANKIASLGNGLATFATEMGPLWNKTVVLVISEFGRTFRENGNRGTDHGHGTVYWVLGGVKGGRVLGEQIRIEQNTLFQDRDYPVLNEYRALMAGLFQAQFGLSEKALQSLFAGVKPLKLGLV